jgi:hypothetical protein
VTYCIDTSCLIAAWEERYPLENFPKFWTYFEQLIDANRVWTPMAVHDEIEKKSKELHKWLGDRARLFIELDEEIQREAKAILARHPRLVMAKKQRFAADPFVIATARVRGLTVVTEEGPTGKLAKPNIPDVCDDYGVEWTNLIRLIRAEAWLIS